MQEVDLQVKASTRTTLSMAMISLETSDSQPGSSPGFMQHKRRANLEVSTSLKRVVLDQRMVASARGLCSLPSRDAYPTSAKPTASCWGQGNDLA